MGPRELALAWYSLLTSLYATVADPLVALGTGSGTPLVAALLLGLLGAASPCLLTTQTSALAIVARRLDAPRAVVLSALAYLLGRVLVFAVVGLAVALAGRELATGLIPVVVVVRKILGPLMLLIGLGFLGVLRLPAWGGWQPSGWLAARLAGAEGPRGSFLLGAGFALCFCPTLFWLFFGLTLPLALRAGVGSGALVPPVFALGTTLPLLGLAGLLALGGGGGRTAGYVQGLGRSQRLFQRVGGVVLVLAGLNDTFLYWLL